MQLTDVFPKIPKVERLVVSNPNAEDQSWELGTPSVEQTASWCDALSRAASVLSGEMGPDESEAGVGDWPPPTHLDCSGGLRLW
jgi:hypothetical protein